MYKKTIQKALIYLFIVTLLPFISLTSLVTAEAAETFSVGAKAAVAIDAKTGKVLFNQNGDTPLPIASMTKMITLYLILETIKEGKLAWEEQIVIDQYVSDLSLDNELSNVPLHAGQSYTVKELVDATAIASANGAAVSLATKIAGSEAAFVDMMRAKLKTWGIKDASIYNASGLNNEDTKGQIYPGSEPNVENSMSAKSMALVAQKLVTDFPEFLEIAKSTTTVFGAGTGDEMPLTSWNWMLPEFDYFKEGVDGLKTGTTNLAGACFTGTITRNDWRIITVVMNANNHAENPGARFEETAKLMDYTYNSWSQKTVYKKGDKLPGVKKLDVIDGKSFSVPTALAEDVTTWIHKDVDPTKVDISFKPKKKVVSSDKSLTAPVDKGLAVGTVTLVFPMDELGYLDGKTRNTYKIETTEAVDKANFFVLVGRSVSSFFSNLF